MTFIHPSMASRWDLESFQGKFLHVQVFFHRHEQNLKNVRNLRDCKWFRKCLQLCVKALTSDYRKTFTSIKRSEWIRLGKPIVSVYIISGLTAALFVLSEGRVWSFGTKLHSMKPLLRIFGQFMIVKETNAKNIFSFFEYRLITTRRQRKMSNNSNWTRRNDWLYHILKRVVSNQSSN